MTRKRKTNRDARLLLADLARCLNACEKAGLNPRLEFGVAFTDAGLVLVIKDKWVTRKLAKLR